MNIIKMDFRCHIVNFNQKLNNMRKFRNELKLNLPLMRESIYDFFHSSLIVIIEHKIIFILTNPIRNLI